MTVWVTGSAGMLGQEVVSSLVEAGYRVIATDRGTDITDARAVSQFWNQQGRIEWVVNCAAWTAVDAAERNEIDATRLNVHGPRVLAETAAVRGAAMIHISTDYVFSGTENRPYAPDHVPAPQGVYGRTKRDGEKAVRSALAHHIIIRTAWLFGARGENFVTTMIRLMRERDEIGVVADQLGLPTYAPDLARTITCVVAKAQSTNAWGTHHFTNAGNIDESETGISWFDFAQEIYRRSRAEELIDTDCRITALTTADYPTPALRPAYSVLDCSSTEKYFKAPQPEWRNALQRFLTGIRNAH